VVYVHRSSFRFVAVVDDVDVEVDDDDSVLVVMMVVDPFVVVANVAAFS